MPLQASQTGWWLAALFLLGLSALAAWMLQRRVAVHERLEREDDRPLPTAAPQP